jgi:hypothetical protein
LNTSSHTPTGLPLRRALASISLALVALLLVTPAALARDLFVATGGSASGSCERDAPCTPEQAINNQARGSDDVTIAAGTYTITAPLVARDQVTVHGATGTRPTLTNDGTGTTNVSQGSGGSIYQSRTLALTDQASASGLYVVQTGQQAFALDLNASATATNVAVVATGDYSAAVTVSGTTSPLLRDALVFASGGAATAIRTSAANLRLRNVLAIAPNVGGDALDISGWGYCYQHVGCPGAVPAAVDAKNIILRGATADVALLSDYAGSHGDLNIDHSNFRPTKVRIPGGPGTGYLNDGGANHATDPRFVNPSAGDYRPAPGSPTIDAGVDDPDDSPADMDGNRRPLGERVDIGPFEYVAPIAPPSPPPPTAPDRGQGAVGGQPLALPANGPSTPSIIQPATQPSRPTGVTPKVQATCRKLRASKRSACIKREQALAKCRRVRSASKRATCVKKAQRIGRPATRGS